MTGVSTVIAIFSSGEWGYLLLSELESLRLPFGLGVERDLYTDGKYLRDFLSEEEIRQLESLG